jgi:C4-dicarboxylate transporter DctM subunit
LEGAASGTRSGVAYGSPWYASRRYCSHPLHALLTAPIILPPLKAAGFDLVWFGVVMTIVMEMGLIHPPVGLNLFVIKNIAPDIPLRDVVWGVMPFVGLMMFAVVVLCVFPGVATWFADAIMGTK